MLKTHRRGAGFTLIEILIGIALLSVIAGLGLLAMRPTLGRGNARALATVLAAELRQVRQQAIAQQRAISVSIPSPAAASFYSLDGEAAPHVSRSVRYDTEYPGTQIFVGTWPTTSATIKNASLPGSKATAWAQYLDDWLPAAYSSDYHFVFTPNGQVVSNDLPAFDQAYHILVAAGTVSNPAAAPGGGTSFMSTPPAYRALSAAGECYTVTLDASGSVTVSPGLVGYSGAGVAIGSSRFIGGLTNPPVLAPGALPLVPQIVDTRITPDPDPDNPPDVYTLSYGEYLTFEVFARAPDGIQLYTGWDDNPLTQPGAAFKGRFSVPPPAPGAVARERMTFYPWYDRDSDGVVDAGEEDLWRSVWTWTPPTTANPGDEYSLALDVTDAAATVHAAISGPPPRVIVSPPGEIIFQSDRNGNWDIFSMWADGTHEEELVNSPQDEVFPSASADGRQVCFIRSGALFIMQTDTSQETLLPIGAVDEAQINPTGQMIAYRRGAEVFVCSTDGSNPTKVADAAPCNMGRVGWSHNGKFVFFDDFNTLKIYCYRIDFNPATSAITPVKMPLEIIDPIPTPPDEKVKAATMSLQGNYIYFVVGNITNPYLARLPLSGVDPATGPQVSGPADKSTSTGINDALVSVSPRGDKVLYCTDQSGTWQLFICDATNWNPRTGMIQLTTTGNNRNPNWIRQRTPLP